MKAAVMGVCVCAVSGGIYANAAFDGGETYALPADQVYSAMASTDIPVKLRGGVLSQQRISKEFASDRRVKWVFTKGYTIVGALIATAQPESSGSTKVTIEFQPGKNAGKAALLVDAQSYARTVGRTVMAEYLDASIERRAPNAAIVDDAVVAFITNNRDAVGRETRAMFDEVSREMVASTSSPSTGTPMTPEEATEPSITFSDEPASAADVAADAARDATGGQ